VQGSLARRGTGLEEVNLVEVDIEMLLARKKQLADDGEPAAGFRVYKQREEEKVGSDDEEREEEKPGGGDEELQESVRE
jgi:hypothetical protein